MGQAGTLIQSLAGYPLLLKLLLSMVPTRFREEHEKHQQQTMEKLKRRMAVTKERPDLIEGLLKKADEWV